MAIEEWTTDERGERYPKYTDAQAQRIARAVWGVHFLLPHPDDVSDPKHALALRNFNRALIDIPPLDEKNGDGRLRRRT